MNDLCAFDLNQLQMPNNRWELLLQTSDTGGSSPGRLPPARTNHSVVAFNDKMYLYVILLNRTRIRKLTSPKFRRYKRLPVVQRCLVLRSRPERVVTVGLYRLHPCAPRGSCRFSGRRCHVHLWWTDRGGDRSRRSRCLSDLISPMVHIPEYGTFALA